MNFNIISKCKTGFIVLISLGLLGCTKVNDTKINDTTAPEGKVVSSFDDELTKPVNTTAADKQWKVKSETENNENDSQEFDSPKDMNTEYEGQVDLSEETGNQRDLKAENDSNIDENTGTDTTVVDIIMVGDILLHTPIEECSELENGEYDYTPIFEDMSEEISKADLALVNEEVIIGGKDLGVSGYPAFNASFELSDALEAAGFDVICHATNHALDKGKKGIINTLENWDKHPNVDVIGIYDSEAEAENIYITEVEGIKLAILNYTYGTNGIAVPEDMPYCVNLLEETKLIEDIKKAEALADFTIVCPHWGTEYRLEPDSMQNKWTKLFYENGVDLVLGTHPHVIEPYEMYGDGDRQMLVYYSLGNFVNWTSGTGEGVANRMLGGMAKVSLSKSVETGEVSISDYGVEAIVCHLENDEGTRNVAVVPLREYDMEKSLKNAIRLQDENFDYDYIINLCNLIWSNGWE